MGVSKKEGRNSRSGSGQAVTTVDGDNNLVKFEDFLSLVTIS
jgi:hypothetical protein